MLENDYLQQINVLANAPRKHKKYVFYINLMLWVEPDLILVKKFCDKFCLKMFSYVVKNIRLRLALIILEETGPDLG